MPSPCYTRAQIAAAVEDSGNQCKPSQRTGMLSNDQQLTTHVPYTRPVVAIRWRVGGHVRAGAGLAGQDRTIVVPFGAGSTPDIVARLVADGLQQKYPGSTFPGREQARRQRQSRHRRGGQGQRPTAPPSASASAARSPSTRCCSRSCPTIRARTSRPITQLVTQPSALAVNPASRSIRSPSWWRCSRTIPANTISLRSATARCRISPWRRSPIKAGTNSCTCPIPARRRRSPR